MLVTVEGNGEGVGVLTRLWEEVGKKLEGEVGGQDDGEGEDDGDEEEDPTMMAEVHWCFRRQDLPSIMKNVSVEDVRMTPS